MLPILVACLFGGIAFASLAVILTRSKGNTLKDVLNSEAFKGKPPESLQIEIDKLQNKFKASAQIPVVALYVVSALVALGVPALMILNPQPVPQPSQKCEEGEVMLSGTITRTSSEGNVYLIPTDLQVQPSGAFRIPLSKSKPSQDYNIESENYSPATMTVGYGKGSNKLYVNVPNVLEDTLAVDTARNVARLKQPIRLDKREVRVVNAVTPAPAPQPAAPAETMMSLENF